MAVVLQMLLPRLSYHYRWKIWQEEEGKAFVASLCFSKQSRGLLGGRVGRRELNFISLGMCHGKVMVMRLDALCGRSLGKWDGFLCVTSAENYVVITQGLVPGDRSWHCRDVCHLPACSRSCAGTQRLSSTFLGSSKNQTQDLRSRTWPLSLHSSFPPTLLWCPLPPSSFVFKAIAIVCINKHTACLVFSLGLKVQSKSVYGFGELILLHPRHLNRLFLYQACRACRMY